MALASIIQQADYELSLNLEGFIVKSMHFLL